MEGRLISAEALKRHYAWWENGTAEMTLDEAKRNFDAIIGVQPTVDAVSVVRCKDCKWKELCEKVSEYKGANGYCSKGERKEDA